MNCGVSECDCEALNEEAVGH